MTAPRDANALATLLSPHCFRALHLVEESITKRALLRKMLARVASFVTSRVSSSELKSMSPSDLATEACYNVGGTPWRKSSLRSGFLLIEGSVVPSNPSHKTFQVCLGDRAGQLGSHFPF